jgi:glycosyltransferase involved in cell wall biosynthesis
MLRSRLLVASSIWFETFGLVVAEAMAAGLPVAVPGEGALAEVAAAAAIGPDGGVGGRAAEILRRSLRRAEDDDLVDAAGAAGRDRFRAEFTRAEGLVRLLDSYSAAIAADACGATARRR